MYYYGYNNGYASGNPGYYQNPCCCGNNGFVGYTQGGYGFGAALWIVLFVLLVIIIGAGWTFGGYNNNNSGPRR